MNVRCAVWVAAVVASSTALADGRIFGTHYDVMTRVPRGGAQVRLEGPALAEPLEVTVDSQGHYAVLAPAGWYRITFLAPHHRPYSSTVLVRANVSIREDFMLCPTDSECDYVYPGQRQPIDVASAAQQPDLSPFVPERRVWGPAMPSRRLLPPRLE